MIQIIFRDSHWRQLSNYFTSRTDVESGVYATYKISSYYNSRRFLVNEIIIPQEKDYLRRSPAGVSFTPEFTEKAFQLCEKTNANLLDIHNHPWADSVNFSHIDDREAKNTKVPYMTKYVKNTNIAFIVFGKLPQIAKARFWNKLSRGLKDVDIIIVI